MLVWLASHLLGNRPCSALSLQPSPKLGPTTLRRSCPTSVWFVPSLVRVLPWLTYLVWLKEPVRALGWEPSSCATLSGLGSSSMSLICQRQKGVTPMRTTCPSIRNWKLTISVCWSGLRLLWLIRWTCQRPRKISRSLRKKWQQTTMSLTTCQWFFLFPVWPTEAWKISLKRRQNSWIRRVSSWFIARMS